MRRPALSPGSCGAWSSYRRTGAASRQGLARPSLWPCALEAACALTRRLCSAPRRLRLQPGPRSRRLWTALRRLHGQGPMDHGVDRQGQQAGQRTCYSQRRPGESTRQPRRPLVWSLWQLQGLRRHRRALRRGRPGCCLSKPSPRPSTTPRWTDAVLKTRSRPSSSWTALPRCWRPASLCSASLSSWPWACSQLRPGRTTPQWAATR